MLYELFVENIALIRSLRLCPGTGMNAITGETGAGKSLIVDAVSLLLGARANDGFIRQGADRSLVEGTFLPPYPKAIAEALGDDGEDTVILSRELLRGGKSIARINGRTVTLARLKEVGHLLINIHGQSEHILLLEESRQMELVDNFGGAPLLQEKDGVKAAFQSWQEAKAQLAEFRAKAAQREERLAQLGADIADIEELSPKAGELASLKEEADLLAHGEKLYDLTDSVYHLLYDADAAVESLSAALQPMEQAARLDKRLEAMAKRLSSLYYEAADAAEEVCRYRDHIDTDLYRLDAVQERIARLTRLVRRFGGDEESTLAYLAESKAELTQLEDTEAAGKALEKAAAAKEADYLAKAARLGSLRNDAAEKLGNAVTAELHALAMQTAVFRVELTPVSPSANGMEAACFCICPNTGEGFQPVSKIASGGELSRIALGLKVILAQLDSVPVLVFDEIDTGLSGHALSAVADRLANISRYTQTLSVSHSALMAAAADHQFLIEKHEEEGRTVTQLHPLDEEGRIGEIARLIAGGAASEVSIRQAKELLAASRS